MKIDLLNRRMFLQGSGGSMMLIPFLSSLVSEKLLAATPKLRSYIRLHVPYAIFNQILINPADNNIAHDQYDAAKAIKIWNMDKVWQTSSLLQDIGDFQQVRNRTYMTHLDKLGYVNHKAIMGGILNYKNGRTIDRYIEATLMKNFSYSKGTIALGPNKDTTWMIQDVQGSGVEPMIQQATPQGALSEITLRYGNSPQKTAELKSGYKKDIDYVLAEYNKYVNSPKLSAADRLRLQEYAAHFSDLRGRIDNQPDKVCDANGVAFSGNGNKLSAAYTRDMLDVLFLNITCGNAAINMHSLQGNNLHSIGHSLIHTKTTPDAIAKHQSLVKPYIQEYFRFIAKLDSTLSSGVSLLTENPVHITVDMSGTKNHAPNQMVSMIVGGEPVFKVGRFVQYGVGSPNLPHDRGNNTRPYSELLLAILQGFGVPSGDYSGEAIDFNYHNSDKAYWDNYSLVPRVLPEVLV